MPRIGDDLSLEPSLDEEDYIHENSDESDGEDYESKHEDVQQYMMEDLISLIKEKF